MTIFELETKLVHISECVSALMLLNSRRDVHGMDSGLLEEEIGELIRARHDTMREYESECVNRGKQEAIDKLHAEFSGNQLTRGLWTKADFLELAR